MGAMTGRDLPEHLGAWVDAGLIARDQADAIEAFESAATEHELPRWVEPVAYLGAALVAVALFLFGIEVWDQLATWGQVALAAVVTLILFGAGLALRRSDTAPAHRAASFTWFLAVGGAAATAGLVMYEALDLPEETAVVVTSAITFAVALGLYLLSRTGIQLVGLAAGSAALVFSIPVMLPLSEAWMVGLSFFAVGLIWLFLTWSGLLTPGATGWVIGGIFALAIGFGEVEANSGLWSGLGIAVGLALVFLSTVVDLRSLLGIGVVGLVVWIPVTVTTIFEGTVAVPIAILITGVVTLTVVIAAVRLGRRGQPPEDAVPSERETADV
jgi:hypothetical protein